MCFKIGSGATPRGGRDVYQDRGVALIRSQNVHNGGFKSEGLAFIGPEHARELEAVTVQSGDVLLNITGDSVARACEAPRALHAARVNQHVSIIRPDPSHLDARFLRYVLVSPWMQTHMLALASAGATRNALTKGMIEDFRIEVPPLAEQRAIASILGALDDKIDLNRRMNETLEAIARALFEERFAASPPTATVGDLLTIDRQSVNPQDFRDESFDHYSIPAFDAGRSPTRERGSSIKSNKFVVAHDCVLLSKLNPSIPRVWLPRCANGRRSIASTEFLVLRPTPAASVEFLFCLLGSVAIREHLVGLASGTSNSHQRVKPDDLLATPAPRPTPAALREFTGTTRPMFERINANIVESVVLAETRDTLLPRLLSGEIRVRDADRVVEAAT
ncbi:MAG: restriction endonuclease subunit S [Planctomycetes bacterium]|nr:restriction endonuclease subunit S [Planctomycetota bacterium]